MEPLLNLFGPSAALASVVLVALPLTVVGLVLRRRGRRGLERLARLERERARLGDVRAGAVTVVGAWRQLSPGRGILEDADGRAVLVEHDGPAPETAPAFLVAGTATGEVDDPRAIDYRSRARVWRVEARAPFGLCGDESSLVTAAQKSAARGAGLGAALFAAGVAVAMASVIIAVRAAMGDGPESF
jgi:hypothetical protein